MERHPATTVPEANLLGLVAGSRLDVRLDRGWIASGVCELVDNILRGNLDESVLVIFTPPV